AILAGYAYEGAVRAAIIAFKYRARTRLAPFLGAWLAAPLATRPLTVDLVVPVPLSPARRSERGVNQAELLARPLALAHAWPLDTSVLVRSRDTRQQTRLSAGDRWANVAGAFAVANPAAVE